MAFKSRSTQKLGHKYLIGYLVEVGIKSKKVDVLFVNIDLSP